MTQYTSSLHTARLRRYLLALACACAALPALAQTASESLPTNTSVRVHNAWARATVQGQKASGVFMELQAKSNTTLLRVASSVAGVAQVHTMTMQGDVMTMRALPNGLPLSAGKTTPLRPGGNHVMLMDLKLPLTKDRSIPLTLVFQDAKGQESQLQLTVPVLTTPPPGAAGPTGHADGHGH